MDTSSNYYNSRTFILSSLNQLWKSHVRLIDDLCYKYGDNHVTSTEDCDDWPLPSQHTNDQVASSVLPQPPVLHPYLGRIL